MLRGTRSKPAGLTCNAVFDSYVQEHVRPNVVDKRRAEDALSNLRIFFGDLHITAIDIPTCRAYTAGRMVGDICVKTKHGLLREASAGTVKRELAVLMAACNHAVRWKRLKRDDLPSLEKPKVLRSKGLWLFPDELERLRAAADQKTRDFIDLCYFTGARRRSIESLTWDQVDLERGRINLAKASDPVTRKRKPIVPISTDLQPLFARLRSATPNADYVFGTAGSMWSGFLRARAKAKLKTLCAKDMRPSGSLSPHVLRHSRATHLLQRGVAPKAVADLLGDDVMTVLRVYGHACPDYLEVALG